MVWASIGILSLYAIVDGNVSLHPSFLLSMSACSLLEPIMAYRSLGCNPSFHCCPPEMWNNSTFMWHSSLHTVMPFEAT